MKTTSWCLVGFTSIVLIGLVVSQNFGVQGDDLSFSEAILTGDGTVQVNAQGNVAESSLFQIGSISKFACSIAIMDMAKDNLLSLDDSVRGLLPGYLGPDGDDIKLIHLLQNRSGLEDGVIVAFRQDSTISMKSIPSQEAANLFAASPVKFVPGSQFDYIISNWVLVQAILEKADAAPIAYVLQKRVFDNAGMSHTSVFSGVPVGGEIAAPINPARPVPDFISCAGGVMSTASDLIKLVRYPYHTAGFPSSLTKQFTTIATADEGYALGGRYTSVSADDVSHLISWQSGSNGPYKSIAIYIPTLDVGYAVVTGDNDRKAIAKRRDDWLESVAK